MCSSGYKDNINLGLLLICCLFLLVILQLKVAEAWSTQYRAPQAPQGFRERLFNSSEHVSRRHRSNDRYGLTDDKYQYMRQGMNALRQAYARRVNRTVSTMPKLQYTSIKLISLAANVLLASSCMETHS